MRKSTDLLNLTLNFKATSHNDVVELTKRKVQLEGLMSYERDKELELRDHKDDSPALGNAYHLWVTVGKNYTNALGRINAAIKKWEKSPKSMEEREAEAKAEREAAEEEARMQAVRDERTQRQAELNKIALEKQRLANAKVAQTINSAKALNDIKQLEIRQSLREKEGKEQRAADLAAMTLREKEQALEHKRALNALDLAKMTTANEEVKAKQAERLEKAKREAEKQAAEIELKKNEDARKQALLEQKKKELENEGVVRQEREREQKWNNIVMQAAMAPQRPTGVIDEISRWDPINNPLNSINNRNYYNNYRPMENRREQSVPPYDLPKNYPVYGGNGYYGYYDYTNSYQPYMPPAKHEFGRKGRTGRRTNWEKFGRPSLRTARDMIRYGLLPPGYEGLRGNPVPTWLATSHTLCL